LRIYTPLNDRFWRKSRFIGIAFGCLKSEISTQKAMQDIFS